MIRYMVQWDPEVEADFIDRWVEADSELRGIFTAASNWVDQELAVDADQKGIYRLDIDARIVDIPVEGSTLAAVAFHVQSADRIVRVVRFMFTRRNGVE